MSATLHRTEGMRAQIADLVLGEDLVVSSPLESTQGFGGDIEHRFQVSNGTERYGVVVIVTALTPPAPNQGEAS